MSSRAVCYGLAQLRSHLQTVDAKRNIFILFTGNKDVTNGKSWCPDCVKAEPVLEKCLESLPENSDFITCYVGDRAT